MCFFYAIYRNFAVIGALEQSYYENGVKKGFLKRDDKVLFSPQAFGIEYVNACQKEENQKICKEYGTGAIKNSTQGGDIAWVCSFFYLSQKK